MVMSLLFGVYFSFFIIAIFVLYNHRVRAKTYVRVDEILVEAGKLGHDMGLPEASKSGFISHPLFHPRGYITVCKQCYFNIMFQTIRHKI